MKQALRNGYTTGSCAAAAALASARWQADGTVLAHAAIELPGGTRLILPVSHLGESLFGVIKDAGDDPDVTDGMLVCAQVAPCDGEEIVFAGGPGVGVVTLPGLKVPVGEPAINPVPRRMIEQAIRPVLSGGLRVTVSIPGGEEVARRTFNPRLGIEGGLSVLGTTGIVRPMSEEALKESLLAELRVRAASGRSALAFSFGESGERAMQNTFCLPAEACVQTSNFVGYLLACAAAEGVVAVLVCGHPGKLAKVAAGTMNTHNGAGDGRIEAICVQAAMMGAPAAFIRELYGSNTTEVAIALIRREGLEGLWPRLAETAASRCAAAVHKRIRVEAAFLDGTGTLLGCSAGAEELAERIRTWEN